MSDEWKPSEGKIADLLARFSPRQLAIGYLRAQRRARENDLAFRVMDGICKAEDAMHSGEYEMACEEIDATLRMVRNHPAGEGHE